MKGTGVEEHQLLNNYFTCDLGDRVYDLGLKILKSSCAPDVAPSGWNYCELRTLATVHLYYVTSSILTSLSAIISNYLYISLLFSQLSVFLLLSLAVSLYLYLNLPIISKSTSLFIPSSFSLSLCVCVWTKNGRICEECKLCHLTGFHKDVKWTETDFHRIHCNST